MSPRPPKHPANNRTGSLAPVVLLLSLLPLATARPAEFYYNCWDGKEGILMRLEIDPASGKFGRHDRVWADPLHPLVEPLRLTSDARAAVMLSVDEEHWGVICVDLAPQPTAPRIIETRGRPELLVMHGNDALFCDNLTAVHLVDPCQGTITRSIDLRSLLDPPAYRIADLATVPGKDLLLVLFHSDARTGARRGNRLVILSLPDLRLLHDLPLPRTHTALHYPGEHPLRGPTPTRIATSTREDRLMLLCDLYGAVASTGLQAALDGRWEHFAFFPTAPDGSWGTSFPDQCGTFELGGRDLLWVANATDNGSLALMDPRDGHLLDCQDTGPGALEACAVLPPLRSLYFTRSGRVRARAAGDVEERHTDSDHLVAFDLSPLASGGKATLRVETLPGIVYRLAAVDPATSHFLLVGLSPLPPPHRDHFLHTIDANTLQTVDRVRVPGVMRHLVAPGRPYPTASR